MRFIPEPPPVQPRDRAAVVATAILQIVETALRDLLRGAHGDAGALHREITALLRDEIDNVARTTLNEIRSPDE
jgi:hypothetical protein